MLLKKCCQCNMTLVLKINYVTVTFISLSSIIFLLSKNILVLLARHDSDELRCPATALINSFSMVKASLYVSVFPNVPAAPGLPCVGEDSKFDLDTH